MCLGDLNVSFHIGFVLFLFLHVNFCNFCNLLHKRCLEYGCSFINNGVVSKIDLWTDRIHFLDNDSAIVAFGKTKIENNSELDKYQF